MSAKDPRAELIAKALKDPKFREQLKKDPAAAIEKALGLKLPAGLTVKVVEDTPAAVHLVLPPAAPALSEGQLGKVAGGAYSSVGGGCIDNSNKQGLPCSPGG
jgi:hypothetical protein